MPAATTDASVLTRLRDDLTLVLEAVSCLTSTPPSVAMTSRRRLVQGVASPSRRAETHEEGCGCAGFQLTAPQAAELSLLELEVGVRTGAIARVGPGGACIAGIQSSLRGWLWLDGEEIISVAQAHLGRVRAWEELAAGQRTASSMRNVIIESVRLVAEIGLQRSGMQALTNDLVAAMRPSVTRWSSSTLARLIAGVSHRDIWELVGEAMQARSARCEEPLWLCLLPTVAGLGGLGLVDAWGESVGVQGAMRAVIVDEEVARALSRSHHVGVVALGETGDARVRASLAGALALEEAATGYQGSIDLQPPGRQTPAQIREMWEDVLQRSVALAADVLAEDARVQ